MTEQNQIQLGKTLWSIADCLTTLDTLITATTQELDTLKTHKKGLMQQLFPMAEAVVA
jgi:type I restriction enzyme S subunit